MGQKCVLGRNERGRRERCTTAPATSGWRGQEIKWRKHDVKHVMYNGTTIYSNQAVATRCVQNFKTSGSNLPRRCIKKCHVRTGQLLRQRFQAKICSAAIINQTKCTEYKCAFCDWPWRWWTADLNPKGNHTAHTKKFRAKMSPLLVSKTQKNISRAVSIRIMSI
jgi:hypothetical protein